MGFAPACGGLIVLKRVIVNYEREKFPCSHTHLECEGCHNDVVRFRQRLIGGCDSSFLLVSPFIIVASLRAPLMVDLDANKHAYMLCSLCDARPRPLFVTQMNCVSNIYIYIYIRRISSRLPFFSLPAGG